MIRVEVTSTEVRDRQVSFTRGGKQREWLVREQGAYAYTIQPNGQPVPHPERIVITLEEGQPPFPVGLYLLAPESIYVNRFGKLEIGRLRLTPLKTGAVKVA